jgi:hypothetical protein
VKFCEPAPENENVSVVCVSFSTSSVGAPCPGTCCAAIAGTLGVVVVDESSCWTSVWLVPAPGEFGVSSSGFAAAEVGGGFGELSSFSMSIPRARGGRETVDCGGDRRAPSSGGCGAAAPQPVIAIAPSATPRRHVTRGCRERSERGVRACSHPRVERERRARQETLHARTVQLRAAIFSAPSRLVF